MKLSGLVEMPFPLPSPRRSEHGSGRPKNPVPGALARVVISFWPRSVRVTRAFSLGERWGEPANILAHVLPLRKPHRLVICSSVTLLAPPSPSLCHSSVFRFNFFNVRDHREKERRWSYILMGNLVQLAWQLYTFRARRWSPIKTDANETEGSHYHYPNDYYRLQSVVPA